MLSDIELTGYLDLVDGTMYHSYTRESANVAEDQDDDWNMEMLDWGDPVPNVPCNYLPQSQLTFRDTSIITVTTPTLSVKRDDPIKVLDRITNIKDSSGARVETGPLFVEAKDPVMGFGKVTNYIVQLRGTHPRRW